MKHLLTLAILTTIALAFWGLQSYEDDRTSNTADSASPHFVDLFINNFTMTTMGDNGRPAYTLQASYLEHYNDDTPSLVKQPVIHLQQASNRWKISASRGEINQEQNLIILHNDVVMQQQNSEFPLELRTEQLELDTEKQIASSEQNVDIVHKQLRLQSKGMRLNNATGELELLASVRGHYARTE